MSLRNQPYFPMYVQDYITDEKLSLCSWETQGIYIKILCNLHKQVEYGSILFKQTSKQNESTINYFAEILIKLIPCPIDKMIFALEELIENDVMQINSEKLYQKRMVKDGAISEARSKAGKTGGGNPNLFKQNYKQEIKQTVKQNTENEIEYKSENDNKDYSFYLDLFSKIEIDVWENLSYEKRMQRFDLVSIEINNSETWMINISRNLKIDYYKLKKYLDEFMKDIQLKTDLANTFPEIKNYFVNWVKKKNTNTNTNQQKSNSQKIDEAVANITLD